MGDRTYVSLQIWGDVRKGEDLDRLNEAIEDEGPSEDYGPGGQPAWRYVAFEEVNYGNVDAILDVLDDLGLSYKQTWDNGGEYSSGCYVGIPGDGRYEFATNGDDIVIQVNDSAETELAAARHVLASMAAFPPYREVDAEGTEAPKPEPEVPEPALPLRTPEEVAAFAKRIDGLAAYVLNEAECADLRDFLRSVCQTET